MARARNIKPSLFKNELLGVADPMLTILFTSLWCLADREGRLEDRPLRIRAETFPYRDNLDINGYLTELSRLGFIHRYEVDGVAVIQIVSFEKHQHPHHTEKKSDLPKYVDKSIGCLLTVKEPDKDGLAPSDSLNTDSLNTDLPNNDQQTKNEKPKNSFLDDHGFVWDLDKLNDMLKATGQKEIDTIRLKAACVLFNPYYQDHDLRENQRLAKMVSWLKNEKPSNPEPKATGLVNDQYAAEIAKKPVSTPESEENWRKLQAEFEIMEKDLL